MNKIIFSVMTLTLLLTVACSDNDEWTVVGSWKLTQFKVDCPTSGESFEFTAKDGCYTFDGTDTCFLLELTEDGKGSVTVTVEGTTDSFTITYTASDTQLTLCDPSGDCDTLLWDDNQLTLEESEGDCSQIYVFDKS